MLNPSDHDLTGIQYLASQNPIQYSPNNLEFMHQITNSPTFHFNRLLNNFYNNPNYLQAPVQDLTGAQQSSSNNSTSDEAEDTQMIGIIDERKQRRMISNRESARRSRMRKQKHLDELWAQVVRLRNENHKLMDKLNHVSESHDLVLQENSKLKEEASDLRQMLTDLQIGSPFTVGALRDLEEVIPCNTAHLRAESTNLSISSSVDLLL
ncbi:basic leucine zipper 43 [Mercurialis annua]|uniref:basic leucine zipper 43 n=1 Tax=Mercurialis annua TaxID=3986 RepID=UPI00215F0FD0|nr:basic leucine zipper 43 [Mercurialis annua]